MSTLEIVSIVFACVFGGASVGLFVGARLPDHHRNTESRDVVKLATGLIATMAALVLSLLISSAKGSFDDMRDEIDRGAANLVLLDRVLAHYGPEVKDIRERMKAGFEERADLLFSNDAAKMAKLKSAAAAAEAERLQDELRALSPSDDAHRRLQSQALDLAATIAATRWMVLTENVVTIPLPLLAVLVFWLTIIFATFGVLAPLNRTVVVALFVCALSASGAVLLVLELETPLLGMIRISDAPMRAAIALLGQ